MASLSWWPIRGTRPLTCAVTWSGRRDSNPRPSPWQGDALPTEPRPRGTRLYQSDHDEQAQAERLRNCRRTGAHAELAQQVLGVMTDGRLAHTQGGSDGGAAQALSEE